MALSQEGLEYHAKVVEGLSSMFSHLALIVETESDTAVDTATWILRARMVRDQTEMFLAVSRTVREFRRAFGHEVDEAVMNQFEMRLDQLSAHLPELLDVTIDGIESSL